jgi:hypothetical protein
VAVWMNSTTAASTGPLLLDKLTKLDKKGEFVVVIESSNQL